MTAAQLPFAKYQPLTSQLGVQHRPEPHFAEAFSLHVSELQHSLNWHSCTFGRKRIPVRIDAPALLPSPLLPFLSETGYHVAKITVQWRMPVTPSLSSPHLPGSGILGKHHHPQLNSSCSSISTLIHMLCS